jgi:hypothetical protein
VQQVFYSPDVNILYPLLLRLEKYMDEHGEEKPKKLVELLSQYR